MIVLNKGVASRSSLLVAPDPVRSWKRPEQTVGGGIQEFRLSGKWRATDGFIGVGVFQLRPEQRILTKGM